MRLLLVHNFYREDGGENSVYRSLAALLQQHGHDVFEYTRDSRELDELSQPDQIALLAQSVRAERTRRESEALVEARRPDIALVQNVFPLITPSIYTSLRQQRIPTIQLVYNYRLICPDSHLYTEGAICERCVRGTMANAIWHRCFRNSRVLSAWYATMIGWHRRQGTFAAIDHFAVPDNFMRQKLGEGGLPIGRMTVVGNPFDISDYAPSSVEDDFALFVGRLIPQKGILTLIRAFARSSAPARLVVIGEGELWAEAEELAAAIAPGRVEFLGGRWGPAVRQYIERCLFVCVPSEWYDNAPLILYQAYAMGRPVIATRIGPLSEVVADSVDGILVGCGRVEEWAAAIERLATRRELRLELGKNARLQAERHFTADAYYQRISGVLELLAGNKAESGQ